MNEILFCQIATEITTYWAVCTNDVGVKTTDSQARIPSMEFKKARLPLQSLDSTRDLINGQ